MRTALKDRKLPNYSKKEELFNSISHGAGAVLSVIGLVFCIYISVTKGNAWSIASGIIYSLSMILLYTMSCLYHGLTGSIAKRVFQIFDHCSIFLLIAGTYTPLMLCNLRLYSPLMAWVVIGVIWACAILGVVLNAIDIKKFSKFSMICYMAMGWCIVMVFYPLSKVLDSFGLWLLVLGGVAYTIGAVLYGVGKKKFTFFHGVFHVFVLVGSILHFFCILFYSLSVNV